MYMDNKVYDVLKWIAQYVLPGGATLYFALSLIWGLPYQTEIVGSLVAFDVFLGAILGVSTMEYQKTKLKEGVSQFTEQGANIVKAVATFPFELSSDAYDRIKWGVLILLPAGGTLYLALSQLWGFPYGNEIVGTIAAITAFLGLVLGYSSNQFKKSIS